MKIENEIQEAIELIASVPGFQETAEDLRLRKIVFDAQLADRGQLSLLGVIRIGPEPFSSSSENIRRVEVAGTLVHEQTHAHQNIFLKTISFWEGIVTKTDPMRRYECPVYARQIAFMRALAAYSEILKPIADHEAAAVLTSFEALYGPWPD